MMMSVLSGLTYSAFWLLIIVECWLFCMTLFCTGYSVSSQVLLIHLTIIELFLGFTRHSFIGKLVLWFFTKKEIPRVSGWTKTLHLWVQLIVSNRKRLRLSSLDTDSPRRDRSGSGDPYCGNLGRVVVLCFVTQSQVSDPLRLIFFFAVWLPGINEQGLSSSFSSGQKEQGRLSGGAVISYCCEGRIVM